MMSSCSILSVDSVDVVRAGRFLLASLSFEVGAGEHWVVMGPNGAGKSTLLSLLGARTHPTRGSVYVLGRKLGTFDMRELRTMIGHVDPRHRAEGGMTAFDVVQTGWSNTAHLLRAEQSTKQKARVTDLLSLVDMADRRDSLWANLSQGERGRILVARALVSRPSLLLLDEPTTGLDVTGREQLLSILGELRDEMPGLSTVLVTHHFEEIPNISTHALLLRGGKTVAIGPAEHALSSASASACFEYPLELSWVQGRCSARSVQRGNVDVFRA